MHCGPLRVPPPACQEKGEERARLAVWSAYDTAFIIHHSFSGGGLNSFIVGDSCLAVAAGPHKLWLWVAVASAVVGPERWTSSGYRHKNSRDGQSGRQGMEGDSLTKEPKAAQLMAYLIFFQLNK